MPDIMASVCVLVDYLVIRELFIYDEKNIKDSGTRKVEINTNSNGINLGNWPCNEVIMRAKIRHSEWLHCCDWFSGARI